jgi:stearoyl-CoA 9-desaturase NADPH oxidoreductase
MTALNAFAYLRTQFDKSIFNSAASVYFEPLVEKYLPGKSLVTNKAKVLSNENAGKDIFILTLQPSSGWSGFSQGQHIQLGVKINAVWHYRTFSIASTLQQYKQGKIIQLCIQKQLKGKVTQWLSDHLHAGDFVTISEAQGSFCLQGGATSALFIAGGTGITPFLSMLQVAAEQQQNIVLLYYAKSQRHILTDQLEALGAFENLQLHLLSSTEHGRFCEEHLLSHCLDFKTRSILICGPAGMIEDSSQLLQRKGVSSENISFEYFKAGNLAQAITGESIPSFIHLKGKSIAAQSNLSILTQLESAGLQPKYGCRMGICKQCQCLKTSGIVFNQVTGKYSEPTEEPIQICISTPVGEVNIDF